MFRRLKDCHNTNDFRLLAKQRLPSPIYHYIDGAADDEVTLQQNTEAYERCDLVPNVLRGVEEIDMSLTLMGKKISMPLFFSPTALQRLFHYQGERAVGKVAEEFGTFLEGMFFVVFERISIQNPQLRIEPTKATSTTQIQKTRLLNSRF